MLCLSESDITLEPVLPDNEQLLEGKHFVGIGSYKPSMREFPEALFKLLQRLLVDTEHAIEESGDVLVPLNNGWIEKDQIFTLGQLIMRHEKQTEKYNETTLFKSVGMALFDLIVADLIYLKATQKGLGQEIMI